jgi:aryl-alcohol dehydrogenase-like predicted oxidoreductase
MAAILARPFVDVVLSGAATVEQLASNLAAATVALTADELGGLAGLVEPADAYWAERSRLAWA